MAGTVTKDTIQRSKSAVDDAKQIYRQIRKEYEDAQRTLPTAVTEMEGHINNIASFVESVEGQLATQSRLPEDSSGGC